MTPVATNDGTLKFDPLTAPPNSHWVPPKWITKSADGVPAAQPSTRNGLGGEWDPKHPKINGIDLTKADPRLRIPSIEIKEQATISCSAIAFRNVNILDSTGAPPYLGDVLVKGQRIVKVGVKLSPEELDGARVFDGEGRRTLMSGLVDAHTHFSWNNAPDLDGLTKLPIEDHTIFSLKSAQTFLDCGYTMCLGAASARERLDLVVKTAIQRGDIVGPRFLANGKEMAPAAGALCAGITRFVETKDDIEKAVNELADMGIDQCKFAMSGEEIIETLRAEDTTFPDELVAAGVEAAHSRGMRVCSHARSDEAIMQCLQYGVDIIYHASFISDETMDALEVQKDRVFVAPAINWIVGTLEDAAAFGYPVSKAEAVGYARELEIAVAGLKEMHRREIKILPGGDYGFLWTPHGTYRDLEHFVKLMGMTPMEAIISATAYGGELMLHPEELGKVIPGAYPDLILVNGDPLEDITLLSHKENLDVILINGRVHKAENVGCKTCGR
ncbi:Amidohydrolase [Mycena venus]|uniref:Amidohydrolase n=1 Tax=Mycena venus TaxID=2733690 RepID=A0A8H6YG70_9AGAR|nr:Amidohydrolase [Mycena venus]